ncbi:MAG: hypothetical protein CVU65_14795 [Deltaproteobacteria bacterium HGW-Deltaproteobacteria-22]|nr:MAG: hypothetical protein CVU65_14795 [Deltaproteobacteria bacterium HGW-Deltaproteobacteria-22]
MLHRIYLTPGMFGFARLASFDYFVHVQHGLERQFADAGQDLEVHVVDVSPTASVCRRAARLAEVVDATAGDDGPIHLLGPSTGGLDARLVASPGVRLANAGAPQRWLPRLRSVTMMNTPHFGTPLAAFFATSKGQRVLHALSAFTIIGLSLGRGPLGIASMFIAMVGRSDHAIGLELHLMDKLVDSLVGMLDDARSPEVRAFLDAIKDDQGAVLQVSPEAMELMVAGIADHPDVVYQSTASMAPTPSVGKWLGTLLSPWQTTSLTLFTTLHGITSGFDERYPCAEMSGDPEKGVAFAGEETEAKLLRLLGKAPDLQANDGIVPLRSQLWGTLVWTGLGDHLDVLGHYRDDRPASGAELSHHDWLTSGSAFGPADFEALMSAVASGMLKASGHRR